MTTPAITSTIPSPRSPIDWFEIPVTDMARAQAFYEALLGTPIWREAMGPNELGVFAGDEAAGVGGCLLAGPNAPTYEIDPHPPPHSSFVGALALLLPTSRPERANWMSVIALSSCSKSTISAIPNPNASSCSAKSWAFHTSFSTAPAAPSPSSRCPDSRRCILLAQRP